MAWTPFVADVYLLAVMSLQAFSKLPDTLDEVDAMLNEERSRAECFTGLSESVRESKTCLTWLFVRKPQVKTGILSLMKKPKLIIVIISLQKHKTLSSSLV